MLQANVYENYLRFVTNDAFNKLWNERKKREREIKLDNDSWKRVSLQKL